MNYLIIDEKQDVWKNYHQTVSDHKDIIRSSMSFQAIILMLKDDINILRNVLQVSHFYINYFLYLLIFIYCFEYHLLI